MISFVVNRILWMLLLLFMQVFIFNHVHIFGYATPLSFVYFILTLPLGCSRNVAMLWGFAMGLSVDIFSNTPGVAAAAMTFAAFVQPSVMNALELKEGIEGTTQGFRTMGRWAYVRYAALVISLHHLVYFVLEYFSYFSVWALLCSFVSSWALTLITCVAFESLRSSK